ncbi:MAG: hypothetical protein ACI8TQ_002047 [Planctomycetota bacterium]|jgi:hypothetical protein
MAVNTTQSGSSLIAWLSLIALSSSCGGGGGGAAAATPEVVVTSAQFASSISQAPETAGSVVVEVELTVPFGTLLEPLEFYVTDLGTGSASPGTDYIALGALTLTFPAGAQNGDRLSVTWVPLDDGSSEGNETLNLALFPVGDAVVVGRASLSAVILDNESSTLLVEEGSRGGNFVPPLANIPMGHQTIGIPTQTGIDVWLDNIGVTSLRISAPTLVGGDTDDFVIETPIQIGSTAVAATPPVDVLSPLFGMSAAMGRQASSIPLQLSNDLLDQLEAHERVILRGTPIPGQDPIDFQLERIPTPVRVDATLVIDGETIEGGLRSITSSGSSWSGHIVGDPDSKVHLSLSEAGSRGWIRPGDADAELLHLRAGSTWAAPSSLVRNSILRGAEAGNVAELCSGTREVPGQERGRLIPAATTDGGSHVPYVCRLALETDYQLYEKFGDPALLATYVTQLVAAVSDRFHHDIATTFEIVYLGIHTTPSDPWTSQDSGGSVSDLLYEFQGAWAPVFGGSWPADADLAHFLSGSLGGGMSFIDVLCNQNYGFGVSTGLTASTDWSTYTGGNSALYWDFDVLAHELGHAFNAKHTHEYCPPLDTCSLGCQGQSCERGTIMSYCHACPGGVGNIDLEFNPRIANEMRIAVGNSCLAEATLASGDATFFRLFFRPLVGTGTKAATLEFTHDATSAPSPYRITLTGSAE